MIIEVTLKEPESFTSDKGGTVKTYYKSVNCVEILETPCILTVFSQYPFHAGKQNVVLDSYDRKTCMASASPVRVSPPKKTV